MFNFSKSTFTLFLLSIIGLASYSVASYAASEDSSLASIEGTTFNSFKIADIINFPASKKVYIETVEASYSKNWITKFRANTSRRYRTSTLQKYSDTLHSQLRKNLASSGWIVLNAPEKDAMRLTAKLVNIHINGPDTIERKHALVLNVGKSGFELTIHDIDNQLALHIQDFGIAGSPVESLIETNNTMNFRGFSKLFNAWSNNLTVFLNIIAEPSSTS